MRAVVVYESMYGHTHAVAEAVGRGLGRVLGDAGVHVGTTETVEAAELADADLVVVGGPTHVHGMSSTTSRSAAAETAEKDPDVDLDESATSMGLREWLDGVARTKGAAGATFDTRLDKPALLTGSAAKGIGKRLRRHGYRLVAAPESFFVETGEGPLADGELDRAERWGADLADRLG